MDFSGRTDWALRPGVELVPDRHHPRAFTLRIGGTDQSYVNLDDPEQLEFDYLQRLADVIDSVAPAGERIRIVHVGGAALTLPRWVAATRPQSAQVVFEPDTDLTAFVRQHLPLPVRTGIKVRDADGRSGVAGLRDAYAEFLVVDAFDGPQVPAELTTVDFLRDALRVVGDGGVVLVNVTDRGPFGYARRVLAGLLATARYAVFCAEPATLKGRRFGNVILAASGRPLPVPDLASRAGRGPYPYRVLAGDRLVQLVAGARPFTEADAERSPAPPSGLSHFG